MILYCNFEELQALGAGADLLLDSGGFGAMGAVAAPPEAIAQVALLQPRLTGALQISTLEEQRWIRRAVAAICTQLHERMDEKVLEYHPAHEQAVSYYFDYAHAFGVLRRLDEIGAEMAAMVELMAGGEVSDKSARGVRFAD